MVYRYIDKPIKRLLPRMRAQKPISSVARLVGVSERTVQRVVRLYHRTGDVVRAPITPCRPRKLSGLEVSFLGGCIERRPDNYTRELQQMLNRECGVSVSQSTLLRALCKRGLTLKKVTWRARERDEEDRQLYQWVIGTGYRADQLVFVGESSCDRQTPRRPYAWAYSGTRAVLRAWSARGKRYSVLPALSLDGILHCGVYEGAYTSELFNDFIRGLLDKMNMFPGRNSVIILDNASIHKSVALREMIETR